MAFFQTYEAFTFTAQSGADANFTVNAAPGLPAFAQSISGTFNGQEITGLSQFGDPLNKLEDDADGNAKYYDGTNPVIGTQGIAEANPADPNATYSGNGLSFMLADGSSVHIYIVGDSNQNFTLQYETSTGSGGPLVLTHTHDVVNPGCFVRGTRVRTAYGEVPVEELAVGDVALTYSGEFRPIRWIGYSVVRPRGSRERRDMLPVRICAGAVGCGTPSRDLRVSPGHALFVEEVLINASLLVNDATIVQEDAETVEYYHVELDRHDLLIADGMPCESYLDDGNRATFLNGADHIRLHGRLDRASQETCRPLVTSGPLLVDARKRLLARAFELGWRLGERPGLRIEAGGRTILPVAAVGSRFWFAIPPETQGALRLRSAAAILDRLDPSCADTRRLGVAVGELRVDGCAIPLASHAFGAGFYPSEDDGHSAWRWMNGEGELTFDVMPMLIEVRLQIVNAVLHCNEVISEEAAHTLPITALN